MPHIGTGRQSQFLQRKYGRNGRAVCPAKGEGEIGLESKSLHGVFFFFKVFAFLKIYPIEFPFKGELNDSFISVSPELHKYHLSAQYITHIVYSVDIIRYSGLLLGREISILDKNSEMAMVTVFVWYTE